MSQNRLANVQVAFKDGKLALMVDTEKSVGTTKDGASTYFANTGGPVELPDYPGVKMSLAIWYKEPTEKAVKTSAETQLVASGIKIGSKAPTTARPTIKINHVKG